MRVRVSRVRFKEREREKTRLRIAPGFDIRTRVQPPPALQFIIALSVPRRLIAVPYGENKCTVQRLRGRRGGEEERELPERRDSVGAGHFIRPLSCLRVSDARKGAKEARRVGNTKNGPGVKEERDAQ